jgi:hypothetical protein
MKLSGRFDVTTGAMGGERRSATGGNGGGGPKVWWHMLTKQSAALRLALPQPFFADARFWGASLSDKPITVAF